MSEEWHTPREEEEELEEKNEESIEILEVDEDPEEEELYLIVPKIPGFSEEEEVSEILEVVESPEEKIPQDVDSFLVVPEDTLQDPREFQIETDELAYD
ncbi:MAG: hypothetical protein E3J70_09490 [Candidatus Heimdallarchaeota archaeon]|nr:MAG: hypothetical protein E3J70_09490 [Candidatus Heimdallarchaeota archaeon]